ncbi:MAG TPA: NAD(P)H-quinone oxidoreductase [Xanthobacteraceae bacterium]|nr:NAD(P)H-quinone oxidoreductase [Xanthobacteraceae bacterium]
MSLPTRMTAIGISAFGPPEMLKAEERPVPQPGESEILVKVEAAGVNRPDVVQRTGNYPPPPGITDIPGLEISGEVVALGPNVARWKLGDRVTALVAGGGYAQYCVVPDVQALPTPANLSAVEAAAIPETFFTVWHNVFERGQLKAGESFLVHGGSSGIGTTAIMLAKAFGAGPIFATAGSAEKCDACVRIGADVAINYKTEDFVAVVKDRTGGKGVNVILDMVGGDYVERNYDAAALEARVVQIAFLHGAKATVDFRKIMHKRLYHTGSGLRPRPVADKGRMAQAIEEKVWPHILAGRVKPVIDSTFPLAEAARAHARMEAGAHIGKIVLTL